MICGFSAIAQETFTPDEIHGTKGIINNKAVNSYGALLILDDKQRWMSILLRESTMTGPLYKYLPDGKKIPNRHAIAAKKITSNTWSFKAFYKSGELGENPVHTYLPGTLSKRKEGAVEYYEIIFFSGPQTKNKLSFDNLWEIYLKSHKMVIEVEIDGSSVQLIFQR